MLKCYFSWRQEHQAWQTRAVFGSSYIPVILTNCLGLVVPFCRWCCYDTAAELPWHLQISLLEGIRKHLSCAGRKQDSWRGSPQPLTRRWHNVTAVWAWTISELSLNRSWGLLRGELNAQAFSKGCMVAPSWWLLHCWSLISFPGVFLCFCKCIRSTHSPLPSPHVFVCIYEWGYRTFIHMPAWFPWGYTPSSFPESVRSAGQPAAHLLKDPHSKSQTLQQMHTRPQKLIYQGPWAVSTSSWPVVPLLLWCTPGLAGTVGSQVLWSHIPLLSSPSSELWGISAHGCSTPMDSRPSCGLYALEQSCLPYFCT